MVLPRKSYILFTWCHPEGPIYRLHGFASKEQSITIITVSLYRVDRSSPRCRPIEGVDSHSTVPPNSLELPFQSVHFCQFFSISIHLIKLTPFLLFNIINNHFMQVIMHVTIIYNTPLIKTPIQNHSWSSGHTNKCTHSFEELSTHNILIHHIHT